MDSESFEYTKLPAQKPGGRGAKTRVVSSPAGVAAAAVAVAAFFAAGTFLLPKAGPVVQPKAGPTAPVLEETAPASAPIEPREARPESPLPVAGLTEQVERPAVELLREPEEQSLAMPAQAPAPGSASTPKGPSLKPAFWPNEKETANVTFKAAVPAQGAADKGRGLPALDSKVADERRLLWDKTKVHKAFSFKIGPNVRPDYRAVQEKSDGVVQEKVEPAYNYKTKGFAELKSASKLKARGAKCPSCEDAEGASGIAIGGQPGGADSGGQFDRGFGGGSGVGFGAGAGIGQLTYVGPCETGSLYRLTNTLGRRLGSTTLVGDSGEVWDVKALKPGESVEIRSRGAINSLSTVR